MFKGIWLQLKCGEIFWVEVKIDALKGEGAKGNDYNIFSPSNNSRHQIIKATIGYYKCKINIPMSNCIICQIYIFNTIIISSTLLTLTVFLTLFAEEFHKGR